MYFLKPICFYLPSPLNSIRSDNFADNDLDLFAEEQGKLYKGNHFTHVHTVSYNPFNFFVKKYINGWSLGCLVLNDTKWYYKKLIDPFWRKGRLVDFAILKEW